MKLDEKLKIESMQIPSDVLTNAKGEVDKCFRMYLKSHVQEKEIKQVCLHYLLARYTIEISGMKTGRADLRESIAEFYGMSDLWRSLLNFDFCIGSCGIAGQELALGKV